MSLGLLSLVSYLIFLGADHRGYELKENIKKFLGELAHDFEDMGASAYEKEDDYVDFAAAVGKKVNESSENKGILFCRSGAGMDAAANKFKNVRAFIGFNVEQVRLARNDDDVNVLILASDFVTEKEANDLVEAFLDIPFQKEERFIRRLNKIKEL